MKLYQTYLSPFPVRVRLALHAKGLDFEVVEPPGFGRAGGSKQDYLAINPMGRVPTLVLDDGRALPESEVICEYLEDSHPSPPLLPRDPWERAQVRLLTRICDVYVVMAMVPLFDAIAQPRAEWDRGAIESALGDLAASLAFVERYTGERYAVGHALTAADGVIPPMLMLACEWARPLFGGPDPLAELPRLRAYRASVESDPFVARAVGEMRSALTARVRQRTGSSG